MFKFRGISLLLKRKRVKALLLQCMLSLENGSIHALGNE